MKGKNLSKIWIAVFIIVLFISSLVGAEERNIYPGDLITLKVSSSTYTIEDLEKEFSDFEIVDIKEIKEGYQLNLRTFETGKYSIILGDKEIEIAVSSTLDDLERDSIFSGDLSPLNSSYSPIWTYIFYGFITILVIILIILARNYLKIKRKASEPPYQQFLRKINALEETEDDYFVHLTYIFKEYLEETFACQIRGKTSEEIMTELEDIPELSDKLTFISQWLRQVDYFKYTEAVPTIEIKEEKQSSLRDLVTEIDDINKNKEIYKDKDVNQEREKTK